MSFLNRPIFPQPSAERVASGNVVNPVITALVQEVYGTDKTPQELIGEWIEDVSAGRTLGKEIGLKPEHIDALLGQARDLIRAGLLDKARTRLLQVLLFEPLESRAVYAVGVTLQLEQRYEEAGQYYMAYVGMKPLDAAGYLRVGECLLGDGSPDEAREFVVGALGHAREQRDATTAEQAGKVLRFIDENRAAIRAGASPAPDNGAAR